jgi:hypothetical protein
MTLDPALLTLAKFSAASSPDDPTIVEAVWRLADRLHDVSAMTELLSLREPLPAAVLESAAKRQEVAIRVAYLQRQDIDPATRIAMLTQERRSDVFAGLLDVAADDTDLADRLVEQFRSRPTKLLAKTMLRKGFRHDDVDFESLLLVIADKNQPDWLHRLIQRLVPRHYAIPEKAVRIADALPLNYLQGIDCSQSCQEFRLRLVERCVEELATAGVVTASSESRRLVSVVSAALTTFAAEPSLDSVLAGALIEAASQPWFKDGEVVLRTLSSRLASLARDDAGEEISPVERARNASGTELLELLDRIRLSTSSRGSKGVQETVQGLLENESVACLPTDFRDVIRAAVPQTLVNAMRATGRVDLFCAIRRELGTSTPDECWKALREPDKARETLFLEALAMVGAGGRGFYPYSSVGSNLLDICRRGLTDSLVLLMPYNVLRGVIAAGGVTDVMQRTIRLQVEHLGSNPTHWESFNTLAKDWSDSYDSLLFASANV